MSDKPALSDEQWTQIKGELTAGNKIEAIKLYRLFTNVGLKEAKDAVDALEAEMGGPASKKSAVGSTGCFGVLLFCLAGAAVLSSLF